MDSGALPGPGLLRAIPGAFYWGARRARVRAWRGGFYRDISITAADAVAKKVVAHAATLRNNGFGAHAYL